MQFRPLLSITLEHGYFADGVAHAVAFRPDAATAHRLRAPWYAWTSRGGQLMIAADAGNPPPVDEAAVPFRFLVWSADPGLAGASEAFLTASAQVARLSTDGEGVREADGRWRLHAGETVAADALADPAPDAAAHPAVPEHRPLIDLTLAPPSAADAPRDCVVRLASRQVFWTYLVQGAEARGPLSVVDAAGEHRFEAAGREPLPGHRTALAFRSAAPVAVVERPPYRFQLRELGGVAERVLIRRLPGAGTRFRPIPGQDGQAMQAEIYVNL